MTERGGILNCSKSHRYTIATFNRRFYSIKGGKGNNGLHIGRLISWFLSLNSVTICMQPSTPSFSRFALFEKNQIPFTQARTRHPQKVWDMPKNRRKESEIFRAYSGEMLRDPRSSTHACTRPCFMHHVIFNNRGKSKLTMGEKELIVLIDFWEISWRWE